MAGNFSKYQRGIVQRYYEHGDTLALQRLSEIVSDLYLAEGNTAVRLWKSAATALEKLLPKDDPRGAKVLKEKNITGLAKLVGDLSAEGKKTPSAAPSPSSSSPSASLPVDPDRPAAPAATPSAPAAQLSSEAAAPSADELKAAMKAFRKRLKLTKLDEESKLGRSPMSGGKSSAVVAIMPPRQYSPAVWEELVRQGKLRKAGQGFYALAE